MKTFRPGSMRALSLYYRTLLTMLLVTTFMLNTDAFGQVCYDCGLTAASGCATISSTDTCQFAASGSITSAHYATAFSNGRAIADSAFAANGLAAGIGSAALASGDAQGHGAFAASQGYASGEYATGLSNGSSQAQYAVAIGDRCIAIGEKAIAIGSSTRADGAGALSLGFANLVDGGSSVGIGAWTKTNSANTFNYVFGKGLSVVNALENDISNSMMFGMNSDVPTVFIGNSGGTAGSYGNVGIGNITDDAASLLHVRDQLRLGYDSEDNGSIVFNNSTNSNAVTIQSGVTSPSSYSLTLPVAAPSSNGQALVGTTAGVLSWADVNADAWLLSGNSGTSATTNFVGTTDPVDLVFRTNNTPKMRIKSGGNVGIGTSTPDGILHLLAASTTDTDLILEKTDNKDAALVFDNNGTQSGSIYYNSGEQMILENAITNKEIRFRVSNGTVTEVMTIDGNDLSVGIGVSNPESKLHVNVEDDDSDTESMALFTVGGNTVERFVFTNASATNGAFAPVMAAVSRQIDRPALMIQAEVDNSNDTLTVPAMVFQVRNDATTFTNRPLFRWEEPNTVRMQMNAGGNLGIGTTTPQGKLDVNGTVFALLSQVNPPNSAGTDVRYDNMTGELFEYTSSINHKTQIEDIQFDKESFLSLKPVDFRWKEAFGGGQDIGLIAEEVEQVMPNMVIYNYKHTYIDQTTGEMLRDSIGNPVVDTTQMQPWGVDYHKIPIYLLALVKEQDSLLNEMRERLGNMESIVQNCCNAEPAYRLGSTEEADLTEAKELRFNVYPNPNDGNFTVDYKLDDGQTGKLFLITLSGEKMLLSNNVRSVGKEDFNISGPSGVYQVILENSRGEILKNVKVVIAK